MVVLVGVVVMIVEVVVVVGEEMVRVGVIEASLRWMIQIDGVAIRRVFEEILRERKRGRCAKKGDGMRRTYSYNVSTI